jgi:hypothetical protein
MTVEQIENDLHKSYQKILLLRNGPKEVEWDSLEIENTIFRNKIELYTSQYPLTLSYEFDSLRKDNIDIIDSEDKLLRIYSWDTRLGGTMYDFGNVFQYRSDNKVYSKIAYDTTSGEGEYIPFYSEIFTLKANNHTYYLAVYNGIYSSKDASQSIRIFTIENSNLINSVKLIKTKNGPINSIDVSFDFFSVVDRPERPLRLIKYDKEKKIVYIPIVYENGKVTDRYILYEFTGQYFEYAGTQ